MSDDTRVPEGWPPPGGSNVTPLRPNNFQPKIVIAALVLLILVIAIANSFYSVAADSQGVVLRFGKHIETTEPGLHFKWPWPINEVITVPVERVQILEFG